jgi:hypothetical protein
MLHSEPSGACDVLVNSDSLPEMGRDSAARYLPHIRRVVRKAFLSINQEAKAAVPGVGTQNCVRELIDAAGGFVCRSRQRFWMRQGYVEEVYAAAGRTPSRGPFPEADRGRNTSRRHTRF